MISSCESATLILAQLRGWKLQYDDMQGTAKAYACTFLANIDIAGDDTHIMVIMLGSCLMHEHDAILMISLC